MSTEKCFCHLNGYKVKDADARAEIEKLEKNTKDFENTCREKIATMESEVASAQSSANSAQSTANSAQSTANSAQGTANSAQSTANSAYSEALNAQEMADSVQRKLIERGSIWDMCLSAVESTANSAQSTANSAQGTANSAQSTANSAYSEALNAQGMASSVEGKLDDRGAIWDMRLSALESSSGGGTKLYKHFIKEPSQGAAFAFLSKQGTQFTIANIKAFFKVSYDGSTLSGNITGNNLIEMSTMFYNDSINYGSTWEKVSHINDKIYCVSNSYTLSDNFTNGNVIFSVEEVE